MDPNTINVPDIIKEGKINDERAVIKEFEDMIGKVYNSGKSSRIVENPQVFLWKLTDEMIRLRTLDLSGFSIDPQLAKDIVFMGPIIRSCVLPSDIEISVPIRKELYLYRYSSIEWEDILDLKNFKNSKAYYLLETNRFKLYLIKRRYVSLSHIVLQNDYLKRICYYNGSFYASSMFLIEYELMKESIYKTITDPVFHRPRDMFDVYEHRIEKRKKRETVIERIDLNYLINNDWDFDELYEGRTLIEIALDRLKNEDHSVLREQIKQMILYMSSHNYIRPPFLYAKVLGIDETDPSIYNLLMERNNRYNIKHSDFGTDASVKNAVQTPIRTISDINNYMICHLVINDMVKNFYEYLAYLSRDIDENIINQIIKYKASGILKYGIDAKLVTDYVAYKCIFMLEDFDIFTTVPFVIEKSIFLLEEIVKRCSVRAFYFIIKYDLSLINYRFESGNTVLHLVSERGEYEDFIKLVLSMERNLLNHPNDDNEIPLMYHARRNSQITKLLLEYGSDANILDNEGNTILHHLVKLTDLDVVRYVCKKYPELINIQNRALETPIILACKAENEDAVYMLKGMEANFNLRDEFGNTAYHYICLNSLCLGLIIDDKQNNFGFYARDYCKLAPSFYHFINEDKT